MAISMENSPEPKKESADEGFPGKLCLLAVFAAAGLYYFLVFVVSGIKAAEASTVDTAALTVGKLAEAHPIALALILIGSLGPALLFPPNARGYLIRLSVVLLICWMLLFEISMHPVSHFAEWVQGFLNISRPLPDMLPER